MVLAVARTPRMLSAVSATTAATASARAADRPAAAPKSARAEYSPKMVAMSAWLPGLSTQKLAHTKQNAARSPYAARRYSASPPARGSIAPSSEYASEATATSTAASAHAASASAGEPAAESAVPGDAKMPLPIMMPTTMPMPS